MPVLGAASFAGPIDFTVKSTKAYPLSLFLEHFFF